MTAPENCYLTNEKVLESSFGYLTNANAICYKIRLGGVEHFITICKTCLGKMMEEREYNSREYFKKTGILRSLMLNGKFGQIDNIRFHWDSEEKGMAEDKMVQFVIKRDLDSMAYPKSPKEKLENLFKSLYEIQTFQGEQISFPYITDFDTWGKWYFDGYKEASFYLKALHEQGVIKIEDEYSEPHSFHFTYEGLNKYIQLFEEGYNSKYCFIAMAFDDSTKEIRAAIKQALVDTGFEPYIVDERYIESERTINDEIIAGLKRSKFCIADFCLHKNGVYFESGFALGQGKQVIYTCSREEFDRAHFDIKPLQNIIYETPTELHDKLVHKIEAWIK